MTDQELTQLIQTISLTVFQQPFEHQANFNRRLKTTGGRYHLSDHHIDINRKMLTEHDQATLVGVIKHELCHYHLHLGHQGYRHRDVAFKQLLQQVGGARYAPASLKKVKTRKIETYRCQSCGQVYQRQRQINVDRYVCRLCRGRLVHLKTEINA